MINKLIKVFIIIELIMVIDKGFCIFDFIFEVNSNGIIVKIVVSEVMIIVFNLCLFVVWMVFIKGIFVFCNLLMVFIFKIELFIIIL